MRKLSYSMTVSLDGYVKDPDGEIDWSEPDEELHRFHNQQAREIGVHLCGRRLYEAMTYWETVDPEAPGVEGEFAAVWKEIPLIVFSSTLETVTGNATLATRGVVEEVERLKAEPGKGISVGGAELASECARHGLIDDYRLFLAPVVLGGGTPYFPPLERRVGLELVETRSFPNGVVYVRYLRTA